MVVDDAWFLSFLNRRWYDLRWLLVGLGLTVVFGGILSGSFPYGEDHLIIIGFVAFGSLHRQWRQEDRQARLQECQANQKNLEGAFE